MGKMVQATEFKAKCLALIDEMERSGEPLTVTRRGKPSITLTAEKAALPSIDSIFGAMKGTATAHADLNGSLDPDWEAQWLATWDQQARDDPR